MSNFDGLLMQQELTRDEGEVLQVYDDGTGNNLRAGMFIKGNPTIGVGRNLVVGISQAEAMFLLNNDITTAVTALDTNIPWWENLDPIRQRVMVNMCFNMGITRLQTFVNFLAAMQTGMWTEAAVQMQQSAWWNEVGARAQRLQYMVLNGAVQPGSI
jgi:lysozyme